jgi:4-amino-4-deoxy-L-arabinose transferase-like glycosyltransferase
VTAASVAANLGGVALFALPGLGLAELLAPLRRLSLTRRLGYAYLLGVLAIGGFLFAASHLFGISLRRPLIGVAILLPALLGLAAWIGRRRWRESGRIPASRWQLLAALVIGAVLLGPLTSALTAPLADWDGRMTWSPLAAYMRHEGTVDASVLRDARWYVMHPRYPPLLPLAQVAVQETFGAGEDEQDYRAVYVAFLVALVLVVHDGARRGAGPRAATLATLCAALPPFLSYGGGGATSGYSDLALAGFYGAALVLLLLERPALASGFAAGCLLAGAVLTKNEGALLALAALLLAAERLLRRRRDPVAGPRALAWFGAAAVPVLAAVALLASWRAAIPNRDDEDYFAVLRLSDLMSGAFTRLPVIVPGALRWTFRGADWLGFWWLFLAVLLAGAYALRRPRVRRLLLAGLTPAAIAWAAYSVSTRLPDLIGETWDRFLVQGLVPLGFVFACALERLLLFRRLREGPPNVHGWTGSPVASAASEDRPA